LRRILANCALICSYHRLGFSIFRDPNEEFINVDIRAFTEHYVDEHDRISGEKTRQHNPRPLRLPKDSNAVVGVHTRATGKALEGADRQNRRTDFPPIIVRYSANLEAISTL